MTTLTNVQMILEELTGTMQGLVRLLPEHKATLHLIPLENMLQALHGFQSAINYLDDSDLNFEGSLNPGTEPNFQIFNNLALRSLKGAVRNIKERNKCDNQVIRNVLGHQIVATLDDTIHIDLEDESFLKGLDKSLAYVLNQGFSEVHQGFFSEGQFETCFKGHCTLVTWAY